MKLLLEILRFFIYSGLIVVISKYVLVKTLRNLAENLKLKPKIVGNIAGITTSVPELLTICVSTATGLGGVSIYNILSSNVINLVQYYISIFMNKNQEILKNKAIKMDIILVIFTIVLPVLLIILKSEFDIAMVPILLLLYCGVYKIDKNVHDLYLKLEDKTIENIQNNKLDRNMKNNRKIIKDILVLILVAVILFVIGNLLGNTLEILCNRFNIPELSIGIILGVITSIPELITFFESQKHHSNVENDIFGVVESTNNLLTSNSINLFIIQSIGIIIFSVFYG